MNIILSPEQLESVREFDFVMGSLHALHNDLYSWRAERLQHTDRIRNAVPVLMMEHSISESAAVTMLKGLITDIEGRAQTIKLELCERYAERMPDNLRRYIEGMELLVGGSCYWSAVCLRYNRPQEEDPDFRFKRNSVRRVPWSGSSPSPSSLPSGPGHGCIREYFGDGEHFSMELE